MNWKGEELAFVAGNAPQHYCFIRVDSWLTQTKTKRSFSELLRISEGNSIACKSSRQEMGGAPALLELPLELGHTCGNTRL